MQRITIKELVDFRRKSGRFRKNYGNKLKHRKEKPKPKEENKDGGDYWISSTSCISNVFRNKNSNLYDSKIAFLQTKIQDAKAPHVKDRLQRNIDIISNFKDFELDDLKPSEDIKFEKTAKAIQTLTIDTFPLFVKPSLVFSFDKKGKKEIGAIWLVPRLNGFTKHELGMFCEMLHRFLIKNYSDKHQISEDHCIAIDTYNAQKVVYSELSKGHIPFLIDKTLNEIKGLP